MVFKYTTKNNERILMWQMFSLAILRQTKQAMVTLFKTAVFCCYLSTLFNTQSALTFEFELFGMAEAQCNVHFVGDWPEKRTIRNKTNAYSFFFEVSVYNFK